MDANRNPAEMSSQLPCWLMQLAAGRPLKTTEGAKLLTVLSFSDSDLNPYYVLTREGRGIDRWVVFPEMVGRCR